MFGQFIILLLIGALSNGYRVLNADMSKLLRKKLVVMFAFAAAIAKMTEIFLMNARRVEFVQITMISNACFLITPVAVAFSINKLMKRLDLVEEYIILL